MVMMANRRIEQSMLLSQRMARGSVHYASTPALAMECESSCGESYGYDTSSGSGYSENGSGRGRIYEFGNRRRIVRGQQSQERSNSGHDDEIQDMLSISETDVMQIESAYRGNKTQVFVCNSLANLYSCPKVSTTCSQVTSWTLTYTGVPILLLDLGITRSRTRRQIQLLLVERGTCFTLWRDVVDNLTGYTSNQEGLFHTFHLSTDHSVRMGLSFDSKKAAIQFHKHLLCLTSDPQNIALSGPWLPRKTHYYMDNVPWGEKMKVCNVKSFNPPTKMDISQPCGFQHIVSVSQPDCRKYFSLKTFVERSFEDSIAKAPSRKKSPAPPPPKINSPNAISSSMSCHNIYALRKK